MDLPAYGASSFAMSAAGSEYHPFVFAAAGTAGTASPAAQNTLPPHPTMTTSALPAGELQQPAAKRGNAVEIAARKSLAAQLLA